MAGTDKAHKVDGDEGAEACWSTPQTAGTSTLVALQPPLGACDPRFQTSFFLAAQGAWRPSAKHGFSINHYLIGSFLLLICLPTTAAVTCRTCFDQVPGGTGGNTCPFVATTAQNGMLLSASRRHWLRRAYVRWV